MTRAQLFARLADLHEETAAVCAALAREEERASRATPSGWISQRESPIGRRAHLALWRRLRDAGSDGVRAAGKSRLIRADVFDASLPRTQCREGTGSVDLVEAASIDLAEAFGVTEVCDGRGRRS